jgi:hypothetical protein
MINFKPVEVAYRSSNPAARPSEGLGELMRYLAE